MRLMPGDCARAWPGAARAAASNARTCLRSRTMMCLVAEMPRGPAWPDHSAFADAGHVRPPGIIVGFRAPCNRWRRGALYPDRIEFEFGRPFKMSSPGQFHLFAETCARMAKEAT